MKSLCQQIYLERLNSSLYSEYVGNELKRALIKEIIQENVLCGLSRNKFFRKTNFNGGTALRLFYHIDRFSEDLDFSVKNEVTDFDIEEYTDGLKNELESSGLQNEIVVKSNAGDKLRRIFVNFPAYLTYKETFGDSGLAETTQQNQKIKIKIDAMNISQCSSPSKQGFDYEKNSTWPIHDGCTLKRFALCSRHHTETTCLRR